MPSQLSFPGTGCYLQHTHLHCNSRLLVGEQKHQPTVRFSESRQFKAAEDMNKASVSAKRTKSRRRKSACNWKCYQGRRFPKARCRKTRRHSRMCTHSRKCSLGTSTWPADEPAGETWTQAFFTVCYCTCTIFSHILKELKLIVLFQRREYFQWLNIIFKQKDKLGIFWTVFRWKNSTDFCAIPVLF